MELLEISAIIDLASLNQETQIAGVEECRDVLLDALGKSNTSQRGLTANLLSTVETVRVLQLLHVVQDVPLEDVACVLCQPAVHQQGNLVQLQEQFVRLDSLVGLLCLLATGEVSEKLQLCFDVLVTRNGASALSLPDLLHMLQGLPLTAAAAQLMLHQASLGWLLTQRSNPAACATQHSNMQVLAAVVTTAFNEVDTAHSGVLHPGPQLQELLYNVATQLTSIIVGMSPAPVPCTVGSGTAVDAAAQHSAACVVDPASSTDTNYSSGNTSHSKNSSRNFTAAERSAYQVERLQHQQAEHLQHSMHSMQQLTSASNQLPPVAQQQPQHAQGQSRSNAHGMSNTAGAPRADVVIMDDVGGCVHYTTSVAEAAVAAVAGRLPRSSSGVRMYQQGGAAAAGQQHQLPPEVSVTRQLSQLIEAQQHPDNTHQLQPNHHNSTDHAAVHSAAPFFTPHHTSTESTLVTRITSDDTYDTRTSPTETASGAEVLSGVSSGAGLPSKRHRISASASKRVLSKLHRMTNEDADAAGGAVGQQMAAGGDVETAEGAPAAPGATEAITATAGNVARSLQRNIAAASARVLVHCSVCFLLTTMVVLGDAALVAGLHMAAKLPLAISFGIAVGANMVLVVLLFATLVLVRLFNNATGRSMTESTHGPQAQQLDNILANISTAIELLKKSEEQQQPEGMQHRPGGTAYTSNSTTAVYRASSMGRDVEQQVAGPPAGLGKLRSVWSAVGRMAGFMQHNDNLGHEDSLQSASLSSPMIINSSQPYIGPTGDNHTAQQQQQQAQHVTAGPSNLGNMANASTGDQTSQVNPVNPGALQLTGAVAVSSAVDDSVSGQAGPVYQQSTSIRVRGSGANVGGSAPGISVRNAYPKI